MTWLAQIPEYDHEVDISELRVEQQIRSALRDATRSSKPSSAANAVLKQFDELISTGPLLCTTNLQKRHGVAEKIPDFDAVTWHAQAIAALAAATVIESQAHDLKVAATQLLQMFLPGYRKNQLQQSRRSMSVLLRCLKFCLTSEGQQAVLAAVICLVVLQVFVDDTMALQAITKEAGYSVGRNSSSTSQLAAWAVTGLILRSNQDCDTIAAAGGSGVLVNQLQVTPMKAIEALAFMAESHASIVWDSLLSYSGLAKLVEQTKMLDLEDEQGLKSLSGLIHSIHKLVQHPHNQEAVLQELKCSETLELCFICAKSGVAAVSGPAIDCLVLIWQWYLRKSPAASFSLSQMSCYFRDEAVATSGGRGGGAETVQPKAGFSPPTAVAKPNGSATVSATADASQLWSTTPVVEFEVNGTVAKRPGHMAAQLERAPHSPQRADSGLPPRPNSKALGPPLRAAAPPPSNPLHRRSNSSRLSMERIRAIPDALLSSFRSSSSVTGRKSSSDAFRSSASVSGYPSSSSDIVRSSASDAGRARTSPRTIPDVLLSSFRSSSSDMGRTRPHRRSSSSSSRAFPAANPIIDNAKAQSGCFTGSPNRSVDPSEFEVHLPSADSLPITPISSTTESQLSIRQRPRTKPQAVTGHGFNSPALARQNSASTQKSRRSLDPGSALPASTAAAALPQHRRHSVSQPDSRRSTSLYTPVKSQYTVQPNAARQSSASQRNHDRQSSALQCNHAKPPVDNVTQSDASVHTPSTPDALNRAGPPGALETAPSEGFSSQRRAGLSGTAPPEGQADDIEHREPDSLQYIQTWLDTNPDGEWLPLSFAQQDASQQATHEGNSPPRAIPNTPYARKPMQRALDFSPQSIAQPGANLAQAEASSKIPSLEDAYLAKRKPARPPATAVHEDSAWDGFSPQVAWSASGSSMLTAPDLESRASQEPRTPVRSQSVVTVDNVSKPSIDSPITNRMSVDHSRASPNHTGSPPSRVSVDHAGSPPSRMSGDDQRVSVDVQKPGGGKFRKFLTWLTDPDTRDAARALKHGRPVKKGALYDLATPIGRCPV